MQRLGLGTAAYPPVPSEVTKKAILQAIEIGYRHFDTASMYGSEQPLSEAIIEAVSVGLIESRDDLFITSKLWCSDAHGDLVLPALRRSLENLKLEYLDLYLIHFPISIKPGSYEFPVREEDLFSMDFRAVWAAMEDCQRLGLTKSIGVSNFSSKKLAHILAFANIPPSVNQICIRWVYEQGVIVLVKSFNSERMKQNLDIFDWSLSEEELEKIDAIPQSRGCDLFTTIDDFWDGEI
ncbi:Aldo/keto reductase [Corchorus olitorius]|uniref:Aldo/keto reductase n=1 Tax=Corchorus olitorius TaxID=93759 RepID=A0A1R3KYN6_9ROSI|nr:Aldo/keto reductase [Corchorus olitorius]